jgi:hypothetical protein
MICDKTLRNIIRIGLRNHPSDCIFTENAEDKIFARCKEACSATSELEMLDVIVKAFEAEELYCPHEGRDQICVKGWFQWSEQEHSK